MNDARARSHAPGGCALADRDALAFDSFAGLRAIGADPRDDEPRYGRFVGTSAPMRRLYDMLGKVGPTSVPVLLVGESGTGKELAARTLHELSPRAQGPFLAVNAGALPSSMVESELFGHERGSFTGAVQRHLGCFERARGGTLLLDEITEMPIDLQVKLLRILEGAPVQRVGGEAEVSFDVRVIAATNMSPETAIAQGRLRADLYFRLGVFRIPLPPLRDREGDLDLLARHFLRGLNEEAGTSRRLASDALDAAARYAWPGNVRELRNLVHASFIVSESLVSLQGFDFTHRFASPIDQAAMPSPEPDSTGETQIVIRVGTTAAEAERQLILATLKQCGGNKVSAARALGLSLKTIYNRLNTYRATTSASSFEAGFEASHDGNGRAAKMGLP